jgi:hypothetical protein
VIVQIIPSFGMTGSTIDFRYFDILLTILMPLAVAVFLIWYSKQAESKGWIS